MAGGELATEPRRTAQAAWNITVYERLLEEDPEAHVAILGDLNSFYDSQPLHVLRDAGFTHVFEKLDQEEPFTYIYQGSSQSLDHILISANLAPLLRRTLILHTNADFPPPAPGDPSPLHKSDHDPIIAVFALGP
jgi:predicted extracellular nuclease